MGYHRAYIYHEGLPIGGRDADMTEDGSLGEQSLDSSKDDIGATIPRTELHYLESSAVQATFAISVALPEEYSERDQTFPVIFVTDPYFVFGSAVESARLHTIDGHMPPAILVGIGYAGEQDTARIMKRRARDFTHTSSPNHPSGESPPWFAEVELGGADEFLTFLDERLLPFVEAEYRVSDDRTYVGHSGGADFGTYVLFHRPEFFDRYLVSSPSVWFDNEIVFEYEAEYAANNDRLPARVFMSVGGEESHEWVDGMRNLADRLRERSYVDFMVTTRVFDEMTHYSVWPVAMNRGLQSLFQEFGNR